MATMIRSDLEFLLRQIEISEAHAAGTPLPNLVANPLFPYGLRTVDGTDNNLIPGQAEFGAADNLFPRATAPAFRNDLDGDTFDANGPAPGGVVTNTNYALSGSVADADPRAISNLIVDQSNNNPAAAAAAAATPGSELVDGTRENGTPFQTNFIPNVTPDEGLSAPFNSWFTFFGQFFDHGLDLLTKDGGSGTVFVPLQPDDPLFGDGPDNVPNSGDETNFMVLTRASNQPGPDGIRGNADDIHEHTNTTTSFVDQNQTYTSHPSHQVFLREYVLNGAGDPVATGKMLEGAAGGLANWAEVKAQAANLLGIRLTDADVTNLPLLATDAYGKFIPGSNGFAQIVTSGNNLVQGNPNAPISTTNAIRTGHAFLDDIAHTANPRNTNGTMKTADADSGTGNPVAAGQYDNELLDRHFVTGDGRGNENIGLTSVHHVFHSEHNRQVDEVKATILATGDQAFIAEWQISPGVWDGERLFQAARFATEMQYQHLVFEEFARKVQPNVNVFTNYQTEIDPSIVAEFAHTVYRFGHSMLTEEVARTNADGSPNNIGLIQAFLNPLEFTDGGTAGTLTADAAAGAIVRGMTRQVGNEIDEFVTDALRDNLLGLPLDLATINLTRGRDAGVASLNAARREFYDGTGDIQLQPYESWADFGRGIRHPESLVNFIAAYGTHPSVEGATTLADKRAAATAIVVDGAGSPADRLDYLNSTGAWANEANGVTTTGLDAVDFWMGGLAERQSPFGGLLGSTFNFVFETQMEKLQDGDRFYYLARTAGLNFLTELEGNSFAKLITANTDNVGRLPGDVFSTPAYILEADISQQTGPDPEGEVIRGGTGANLNLQYTGGDHVVLGGTVGNNSLIAGIGDDTIHGDGGNDRINGGAGNDQLIGDEGDDIISDAFGDDNIKGGEGHDVISAGAGIDLILGEDGNDFVVAGRDPKETFGGLGNDFIIAGDDADVVFGNEGNDWIEGGNGADLLQGDNGNPFQNDTVNGHDVIIGDGGNDDYDSESGDDIMVTGPGIGRHEGMLGFDWVTHRGDPAAANADLFFTGLQPPDEENVRDRFDDVEALSGWNLNDTLRGDDRNNAVDGLVGHQLTTANIPLITGLQDVLGAGVTSYNSGNIILGGDGNDLIEGRGGDDIIDGDRWLNVRLQATDINNNVISADSMTQLQAAAFAGQINPGSIQIVREILTANGSGDINTALFSGPRADYTISTPDSQGRITVTDTVGTDGTDTVRNIERLQFEDQVVIIAGNSAPSGAPTINDATPTEGQPLTASTAGITDPDGTTGAAFTFQWQRSADGITWAAIAGATAAVYTPVQADVNQRLRVQATFTDDAGTSETVTSAATGGVGDLINGDAAANTIDGAAFDDTINGLGGNDVLNGLAGTDVLNGGAGNDVHNGGLGADQMAGGPSADTYVVDNAGDVVTEAAAQGSDTVQTTLSSYTLGATVENLTFTGAGNFTGTGNGLANTMVGGGGADTLNAAGGADIVNGGAGNDVLNGGTAVDQMSGGAGNDTYVVDNTGDVVTEVAGQGTDTVQTTLSSYTLGATVENLTFTGAGNFSGTGNGLANTINGGSGADSLNGVAGADRLTGGAGNDSLNGGLDNDTFVFGAGFGNDTIAAGFDANATGGQDLLNIAGLGITNATFANSVTITDVGANTLVGIGNASITLVGVGNATTITQADFILAQ